MLLQIGKHRIRMCNPVMTIEKYIIPGTTHIGVLLRAQKVQSLSILPKGCVEENANNATV